jgi:hypothetical protein
VKTSGIQSIRCKQLQSVTRRHFLQTGPLGVGALALSSLMGRTGAGNAGAHDSGQRGCLFRASARSVIFLHMAGSPPHLDLFDYKPELNKRHGQDCPAEYFQGKRFAFTSQQPTLLGSPHKFRQFGHCGMWMSDALPQLSAMVDDLCMIRSMNTDQFNHAPAELMLYTGSPRLGRPSMGSWVTYGLGSENADLPGFVVLVSSGTNPSSGKSVWGSGFLPSVYQGVQCRTDGDPVLFVSNPRGMDRQVRRMSLDALNDLNRIQYERFRDEETQTRIAQFELAFRMQVSVPEVMDISRETSATLSDFGAVPGEASFANNCLLARRLVEQGVRFVQLFDWGWDFHGTSREQSLGDGLREKCRGTDRAVAALLRDLKARGLLDETLVMFSGEFGRTPFREGRTAKGTILGRDHYPDCYSMLLAGGGIQGGVIYGESDELGFQVARDKVHVHDLQATILHLLGVDHERLTFRYQGRDFRLTDVHGQVVPGILTPSARSAAT